jgi:hypothetical protein
VAGGGQGVAEGGGFGLEGDVADPVADQQRDATQPVEFLVEPAGALGAVEAPGLRGQEQRPTPAQVILQDCHRPGEAARRRA